VGRGLDGPQHRDARLDAARHAHAAPGPPLIWRPQTNFLMTWESDAVFACVTIGEYHRIVASCPRRAAASPGSNASNGLERDIQRGRLRFHGRRGGTTLTW
jgi:hypothetical protein